MSKEVLTDPIIYHGPGGCPDCCGPIIVADAECSIMELNAEGDPISEETAIRVTGICKDCGKRIPMMRYKGGYRQYNETSRFLLMKDAEYEAKIRVQELNRSSKVNPFALE